ncbi:hypothetical protein AB0F17_63025 [Nonomuraea sp. NPDC026600]|uniref:hypothetical protein n=1 Tax=Nonomuraea sp. NPDC026600 TaxID=3155363 RepID=UPI0033DBAB3F
MIDPVKSLLLTVIAAGRHCSESFDKDGRILHRGFAVMTRSVLSQTRTRPSPAYQDEGQHGEAEDGQHDDGHGDRAVAEETRQG